MKKITYNDMKKTIEVNGYKLASDDYTNQLTPLELICDKGHLFTSNLKRFKKGQRCPECAIENRRHSYNYVKSYIEGVGCKLLSDNYTSDRRQKLEVMCDKSHVFLVTFKDFKNGVRCNYCNGNNAKKHTYSYVKNYIENEGFTLISSKYDNKKEKLKIECVKNHVFNMSFGAFKQGRRCPKCAKERMMHTYSFVKNFVESNEYKLLSNEYLGSYCKIRLQCPKKHIFNMSFTKFYNCSERCPKCNISKGELEVENFLKKNSIIFQKEKTFEGCRGNSKLLKFDFYLPEHNTCIEYDGGQHFNPVDFFGGEKYFEIRKDYDARKTKYCLNNNINLIRITDKEFKKIEDILNNKFKVI